MNFLFSSIGRRGYIANYFRTCLESGDRIIGTGNSEWTSGFLACDAAFLLPNIQDENYIPKLLQLCIKENINVLISFSDIDINILTNHHKELHKIGVIPLLPSPKVNRICLDKYAAYQFYQQHGFKTPQTFIDLETALASLDTGSLSFPVILKPRYGSGSAHIFVARNVRELEVFFHYQPDMLIQERLAGQEYGLDICSDLQGQVLAVVPRKKIAMRSGETDQAEVHYAPELIDFGLHLGQALKHVGPLDCDLFVLDNEIYVLEVNPRFGGGYPISHLAGADFPRLIYRMLKGESVAPQVGAFQPGFIMMKEYAICGGMPELLFKNVSKEFI
jgi:carbamoyl-phosphate synthase large subunit